MKKLCIYIVYFSLLSTLCSCDAFLSGQHGPKIQAYRTAGRPTLRAFFCDPVTGTPRDKFGLGSDRVGIGAIWTGADNPALVPPEEEDIISLYLRNNGDKKPYSDAFEICFTASVEGCTYYDIGFLLPPDFSEGHVVLEAVLYDESEQHPPNPPFTPTSTHLKCAKSSDVRWAMLIDSFDVEENFTKKEILASATTWGEYTAGLGSFHIMPFFAQTEPPYDVDSLEHWRNVYKFWLALCPSALGIYSGDENDRDEFWCSYDGAYGDGRFMNSGSYMWAKPTPIPPGNNGLPLTLTNYNFKLGKAKENIPNLWCWQQYQITITSGFQQAGKRYFGYIGGSAYDVIWNRNTLGSNCEQFVWQLLKKAKYSGLVSYDSCAYNDILGMTKYFTETPKLCTGKDIIDKAERGDIIEYNERVSGYWHTCLLTYLPQGDEKMDYNRWQVVSCNGLWSVWNCGTTTHLLGDLRSTDFIDYDGQMAIDDISWDHHWGRTWPPHPRYNTWTIEDISLISVPEN